MFYLFKMFFQVAIVVLAVLQQQGVAQECGVVVVSQSQLKEDIRREVNTAVQWAAINITETVEQLLAPLLEEISSQTGKSPDHPAKSCEDIKETSPNSRSGYYWIQTPELPLVQMYCDMYKVCLGESSRHPAPSCKVILEENPESPSGYYWIKDTSDSAVRVYCDMTKTCGGVTGGWMQLAKINMANTSHSCPQGLKTLTSPKRLCSMNIGGTGCSSTSFTTHGVEYTHVCGKVIGYQQKTPDAFGPYQGNNPPTIDGGYVDGISITHGSSPRQHIWTLAAALHEVTTHPHSICPCTNNAATINIPPFVGNDYFCDTASENYVQFRFYPDDPLWDGEGCGPPNTCCSLNNPPWFMKELSSSTTDDIEMRLCADQSRSDEDITVEIIELYLR